MTPIPATPEPEDWDAPPRRTPDEGAPVLSVEGFEGPLDWLLELVRAEKIDLTKLSIVALVDAFADAFEAGLARRSGRHDLAQWGAWLVMAANLTLLRSRLLLPADDTAARAAMAEAEGFRRQLTDRAEVHAAASWLEARPQLGHEVFARGVPEQPASDRVLDIAELLRACLVVLRVPEAAAAAFVARPRLWTVAEAVARIKAVLAEHPEGVGLERCLPPVPADAAHRELRCRAAMAATFAAGLELARTGAMRLIQEGDDLKFHAFRWQDG